MPFFLLSPEVLPSRVSARVFLRSLVARVGKLTESAQSPFIELPAQTIVNVYLVLDRTKILERRYDAERIQVKNDAL